IKIMSAMNLCVLLNYHITCPFPAAQIRFPAFLPRRSENPEFRIFLSLRTAPSPVSTICSAGFICL
ncbi:TPA: hypothetical protein ACHKV1_003676, partial [Escherichia coli]